MVVHHHTSAGTLVVVQHAFGPIIWQSILFQMIFRDMSQIIVCKYRNMCHVRHINRSSGYPCNINT